MLMEDQRFSFIQEPLGLEHIWRRLTTTETYSPKVWTDRYLAAFAMAESLAVVTFDGAFRGIPDLDVVDLNRTA
jgi:uncharacterized protein